MNPTAIYSKSGKGVQEASGKTSLLKRPDRAVLSAIDGRATLADVAQKVGRPYDPSFQALIGQLDKEGFIRQVTAAGASAPLSSPPSRPAPPKPAAKPMDPASDLDFSSLGASKPASPPSRPASPPAPKPPSPQQAQLAKVQQSALDKAREDAEAKAAADRERVKREAEEKAKAEIESKMRAEAEKRMKDEAEARARAAAAAEAKAKAEAEANAKLEVERKAREEAERARREAEEQARREAEELRQKLEAERRARDEAERKAREEAERKAREEAERVRRELEAERQRLEEERRKEEEERAARRRQRDEEDRREEEERAARRKQRDEEEREHAAQSARRAEKQAEAPPPPEAPKAPARGGSFADSLLADLDSFTNKDEEEQKARHESEKAEAEAEQRRRDEAEREAAEREAEACRKEEEEARRREDEKRRAREEEERIAREEERRKREAEEIQRKAEAATAAAMAKQAEAGGDIPISDEDLDLDEVKQERQALGIDEKQEKQKAKEAEREAKRKRRAEEKRQREAEKRAAKTAAPLGPRVRRPPSSWGRPVAFFLLVILLAAVGAAHVVPLEVTPYEKAATEALGQPVRIGSARLWLFTGVQVRFDGVRVGDARIGRVVTRPALGSVFGEQKHFSQIELEGVALPQAAFGEALFARVKSDRFSVERIVARDLELQGGLALPKLDAEVALNPGGAVSSATLRGPDGLNARIVPKGETLELEATAAGLPLPIGPDVTLSQFAMKGTATRQGMNIAEWGGAILNGAISGTARMHWGSTWEVDGVVTVRGINAAVFAPALLSQGNADGTGRFSMSGTEPAKLLGTGRLDGRFSISKGTLGSFDLSRAIQSRGKTVGGTTQFSELNGQVSYDRGTVALRNVTIGAGALNAGASADISKGGALTGRIVADVKTAAQTLSATLNLGGTVKEPQVRD